MTREEGYYYVRFKTEWVIARWDGKIFNGGSEYDAWAGYIFVEEINETRILSPDEKLTHTISLGDNILNAKRHILVNGEISYPKGDETLLIKQFWESEGYATSIDEAGTLFVFIKNSDVTRGVPLLNHIMTDETDE